MARQIPRTKVYVVDDSLTIRAMLETLIDKENNLFICGMAGDAETALSEIDDCLPDIILLDLALPGMDGMAFLRAIRAHWHPMSVIIVSSSAKRAASVCYEAFRRGAVACFDKSKIVKCADEFIELIDDVAIGRIEPERYSGDAVTLPAALEATNSLAPQYTPTGLSANRGQIPDA